MYPCTRLAETRSASKSSWRHHILLLLILQILTGPKGLHTHKSTTVDFGVTWNFSTSDRGIESLKNVKMRFMGERFYLIMKKDV